MLNQLGPRLVRIIGLSCLAGDILYVVAVIADQAAYSPERTALAVVAFVAAAIMITIPIPLP